MDKMFQHIEYRGYGVTIFYDPDRGFYSFETSFGDGIEGFPSALAAMRAARDSVDAHKALKREATDDPFREIA